MGERRGAVSATELMAQLEQDPEFLARREKIDAEVAALAAERQLACEPVVADLRMQGVEVESVWELYKDPESYPVAIPVLLAHLRRNYSERTLEDIGNALPFKPAVRHHLHEVNGDPALSSQDVNVLLSPVALRYVSGSDGLPCDRRVHIVGDTPTVESGVGVGRLVGVVDGRVTIFVSGHGRMLFR